MSIAREAGALEGKTPSKDELLSDSIGMGYQGSHEPVGEESDIQKASHDRSQKKQPIRVENKVGPNDPCPCGSGRKYKKCHGAVV